MIPNSLAPKHVKLMSEQILSTAISYCIIEMSPAYIDKHNILRATLKGFHKAFIGLEPPARQCLVDGPYIPYELKGIAFPVIKGDQLHAAIAAASVIAKSPS